MSHNLLQNNLCLLKFSMITQVITLIPQCKCQCIHSITCCWRMLMKRNLVCLMTLTELLLFIRPPIKMIKETLFVAGRCFPSAGKVGNLPCLEPITSMQHARHDLLHYFNSSSLSNAWRCIFSEFIEMHSSMEDRARHVIVTAADSRTSSLF